MSHSFYPPLMQRTSWTLAVPFKEQDCHRGPSDSIGNNYSLTARDMKLKDLLKVYQPVTINVPRDKTSQGVPGTCDQYAISCAGWGFERKLLLLGFYPGYALCWT